MRDEKTMIETVMPAEAIPPGPVTAEKLKELFFKVRICFRRKNLFGERLAQAKSDLEKAQIDYVDASNQWTAAVSTAEGTVLDRFDQMLGSPFGNHLFRRNDKNMSQCQRCEGTGWVCDRHPDQPFELSNGGNCCAGGSPERCDHSQERK